MKLLGLVITLALAASTVTCDTLELVQVLFRHGDRSPTDPFPNDVNNDYWNNQVDGFGMLTNIGKQQQKALGQYLRQRYSGFLNETYSHLQFTINSTDVDRTLMSAMCNLAGLYPPVGDDVWNPSIAWQPIPVHSRPTETDYILDTDMPCPKYDHLFDAVKQSPEVVAINLENEYLYEYVANQSGSPVTDMFSMDHITDALFCDMSNNLPWPSWVPPIWDQMMYLHNIQPYYKYGIPELARLKGGSLLGSMIWNMKWKKTGLIPTAKANWFSSHDSIVSAFLSAMGVFNIMPPPYACAVILELYKSDTDAYSVQIYFRNDTTVDPHPLTIPNCTFQCPLDQFIALTEPMVPTDIVNECNVIPPTQVLSPLHLIWNSIVG